jgi:zinc transport system permease protein
MDDFLLRALAAGVGVAAAAGPLGCFVAWRRMAYFGETVAHAALLGIALGLVLGTLPALGAVAVCAAVAVLMAVLERSGKVAADTLLAILAHGALSLGLIVLAFMERVRVDLLGFLFGDILAVTAVDVGLVYGGGALVLAGLAAVWRPLLAVTVHEELARVEGVPAGRVRLLFALLVAIAVALAMKVVGVLLVVSLLMIPAGAARFLARTPAGAAAVAAAVGCVAVVGGLAASYAFDAPAGPSIVAAALALFAAAALAPRARAVS